MSEQKGDQAYHQTHAYLALNTVSGKLRHLIRNRAVTIGKEALAGFREIENGGDSSSAPVK